MNTATLCVLTGLWSIGVGGNLPVDSAVFLGQATVSELWGMWTDSPRRVHAQLAPIPADGALRLVGVRPARGLPRTSLHNLRPRAAHAAQVAWPLIGNYSCAATATVCTKSENAGWRYFLYTMGGLMLLAWGLRFLAFGLTESPKFLMGRGRDADAVAAVHRVAAYNKFESSLTLEQLTAAGELRVSAREEHRQEYTTTMAAIRRSIAVFDSDLVRALFATRKMAYSTSLLIVLWGKSHFLACPA
jgi:hypothetical protein